MAGVFAAATILFAPGVAPAADNVALSGTVVHRGKPVAGAAVSVLDRTTTTGPDGAFRLEGVPAVHRISFRVYRKAKDGAWEYRDVDVSVSLLTIAAHVEIVEKAGIFGLATRRVDLGAIRPISAGDAGRAVTVDLSAIGDWDGYCRGCHPTSPVTEPKAIVRPAKPETPAPAVTGDLYASHRFRDSHPSGVAYGRAAASARGGARFRKNVESLPLDDGNRVDCRTCHTFHVPGPAPAYARAEFERTSALCTRCHL
jgi:hypothetical protein